MQRLLGSFFGLGYLPLMPGTFASALVFLLYGGLAHIERSWLPACALAGMLITGCGALLLARELPQTFGERDPPAFVLDEMAGACLVLLAGPDLLFGGLSFIIYRIVDVLKPWGMKEIEQLPSPRGVLLDDLAAALVAMLPVLAARLWPGAP